MKNILVIGGSYFTGRVFVEKLVELPGYAICVFNRGNVALPIAGVQQITGDREVVDHITMRIPPKYWDVVVDFCAYNPEHIDTVINGLSGKIGHYIFISTTSVYAPENDPPVGENGKKVASSQTDLGEFADYGLKKWQAECKLMQQCSDHGFSYTILRPAIIYGRYNYARRESWFFDAILRGKLLVVPGRASARLSFLWVEDLAQLISRCVEASTDGLSAAYNVAAPERLTYAGLLEVMERECGRKPLVKKMALRQIYRENIYLPFPSDIDLLYDGRTIASVFGYEYTPFSIGIRNTWQHYRKSVA
jgi:2'-hydroxyisoflavone reductase